jgi:hypothetical protein
MSKFFNKIEGIRKHPLWGALTGKQQRFLETYLETKNSLEASKAAYNTANEKSAMAIAARTLRNPNIRQLVALHSGHEIRPASSLVSRRELAELISEKLRKKIGDTVFLRLAEMYSDLQGFDGPKKPIADTRGVDDLVAEIENKKRQEKPQ